APRPSPAVDPTRNASILELSRRGTVSAHRKRQSILLGIALVAVAAFLVSFITGVRLPGRAGQDGSPFDGIPDAGGDRTRVEVLNAAGRPGIARMATRRLRESGFDVVYFGNAEEFGR